MDDMIAGFKKVPPVTRYYLLITLLFSFCMTYQIINPYSLVLDWSSVFSGQIWRVLTTFFFVGPFCMSFLFGMAMIYYTISSIETYFGNRQADLGTMLLFNAVVCILFATVANDYLIM